MSAHPIELIARAQSFQPVLVTVRALLCPERIRRVQSGNEVLHRAEMAARVIRCARQNKTPAPRYSHIFSPLQFQTLRAPHPNDITKSHRFVAALTARLRGAPIVRIEILMTASPARAQAQQIPMRVHALHVQRIAAVHPGRALHQLRLRKQPSGRIQGEYPSDTAVQQTARQAGDLRTETVSDQRHVAPPNAVAPQLVHELSQALRNDARIGGGQRIFGLRQSRPVQLAECAADVPLVGVGDTSIPVPIVTVKPAVNHNRHRLAGVQRATALLVAGILAPVVIVDQRDGDEFRRVSACDASDILMVVFANKWISKKTNLRRSTSKRHQIASR